METRNKLLVMPILAIFVIAAMGVYYLTTPTGGKEILIYTSDSGIELMLEATIPAFTAKTGIKVSYVCPDSSC